MKKVSKTSLCFVPLAQAVCDYTAVGGSGSTLPTAAATCGTGGTWGQPSGSITATASKTSLSDCYGYC